MKIAMIGQKGIPSRAGGVEIHVEEIAKRLVKKGHDVDVYCRQAYCETSEKQYHGINLKYISSINTKHLDAISYTFLSTINTIFSKYDIVHYHALGPSTLSFIPRIFGKKVICTIHGLDWQREKWGKVAKLYLKFGEYSAVKFPSKTISVSETLVNYCKNKYNKNVVYIPNGVSMPVLKEANIIYDKYGLQKDGYILFLARLVPEKGAHYLIEAYNKINTSKKLVIAGGSSHSDEYVNYLKHLTEGNSNICFTNFVKGEELEELYSNAYLYVLPSEIEGFPISLLEAMSYGQCCLVSDIRENKSVIKHYGYTFVSRDSIDLKNKLEYLLSNEEIANENRKVIQAFVQKNYDWDFVVDETEQLYNSMFYS